MTQPAQEPALDDQHRGFDLCLVARPARPCRQDRRVVMRRHLGVAAIDLRFVKAGLDDRDFGIVRHQQPGHAADGGKGSRVGSDPIAEPLRPVRFGIGEVGGPEHGDKNLRRPGLAIEPIDDHRHRVTGVIDKQTACRRRCGFAASSTTAATPSCGTVRRSGNSDTRPDSARCTRPTGSAA